MVPLVSGPMVFRVPSWQHRLGAEGFEVSGFWCPGRPEAHPLGAAA